MRYATGLARNPHATYRQIDIAGRTTTDSHGLVTVLYEEAVGALRSAAWATENSRFSVKNEKIARATAVLFALESGLDFDKGGDVSRTLATFYHGIRQQVVHASIGSDPA
ncbi:MAG: flagellar protein FliS, partial [Sphingomonadales bacterium]